MKMRVVIADRDEMLLAAYRAFLAAEGFEVATATSGAACLEALRQDETTVFVLDPDPPWDSGLGVLAKLREEKLSCPHVLLLTANPSLVAESVVPDRDYALMIKPVPPATVASIVRGLTDGNWDRP
jgi:DNA-binding response OmpR family regulator